MGTQKHATESISLSDTGVHMATSSVSWMLRHAGDRIHAPEFIAVPIAAAATAVLFSLGRKGVNRYVKPKAVKMQAGCSRLLRKGGAKIHSYANRDEILTLRI
ncbi:TPA: hypothetical protein HA310_03680 [Candidatus Micrarchaeota archaeon]|nr:hypothetical protein [Candidatus Micrarchaeota archaeon]